MRKYLMITVGLLFVFSSLKAGENMIVKEYSTENGLPHNTVFCAQKDADGFMWFGTWYGLTSFDGVKFRSYNSRDDYNTDIPPHKLQNIVESKDGNLWVKTIDHKLYLFEKRKEQYFDVFNEIKKKYSSVSPKIIKIQKTQAGDLLLLTKNRDLLKAVSVGDGRVAVSLLYDSQSKRDNRPTNNYLLEDAAYINWIGLDFKIISCRKGAALASKPSDFVLRKIAAEQGHEFSCAYQEGKYLWIGDNSGNIFKIDYNTGNVSRVTAFEGAGRVQNLIQLNGRTLFVAIAGKGVFEYDERTGNSKQSVALGGGETVSDFFVDCYDKLWIDLNQNSVIYYDPFNHSNKRMSLPAGAVNKTIKFVDGKEQGMFLLGTTGDVFWFDRSTMNVSLLNAEPQMAVNGEKKFFFDIFFDKDNILWLSSTTNGAYRVSFPKRQFTLFSLPSAVSSDGAVKTMFQSKNGDIWVGTRQGEVYHLDSKGTVKQLFSDKNYRIGNVYHIMEDRRGNLWFSTKGNGLVKAEPNGASPMGYLFTRFEYNEQNPASLSANDVYYTYEDHHHRIWVATFGGGLNLITQSKGQVRFLNKFNSFDNYPRYGLYMEVRNVTEDKDGRIWVGTSDGLMSFDGNFKNPSSVGFEIYRNERLGSNVYDNDVYVLYKDASSQIWVSVFGGGLNKLIKYDAKEKCPVFKAYGKKEGLNSDVILSIVEDNDNSLWLATETTLSRFDKKKETFRNLDRYDGFLNVQMEEESAMKLNSGSLWFGTRKGIISFNPQKIESYNCNYKTFIVDFLVSNRELRSLENSPLKESVRYAQSVTLKHNQSNFVVEFAALNYYNQNRVAYKYILEGYDEDWHYNGRNRIASYPNVPPGKYTFRVQTVDMANDALKSECSIEVIILPPWWLTWWAKGFYFLLLLVIVYVSVRGVLFYIRVRNEMYVEQRVSELKIKFFTNISHELRTPLTLIMGPIQELRQKQQLTEKGLQYVSMIEKNANQMLQLVNQILDFRKIQNGKMILHVSQLSLADLVASMHKEFSVMAEENEISFTLNRSEEEVMLWADKEKLEIVIRNLLSNAFKFTQAGGAIYLSASLSEDNKRCYIRVEDTGVGIPQNKLTEIFERFFQGDNAKNVQSPGTGIGLALSKEIVALHHGEIRVESKQDQGSVFTVELLLGKEHFNPAEVNFYVSDEMAGTLVQTDMTADVEPDEPDTDSSVSLPVVVVVEDNRDLCNLLRMQLDERFKVYTASNGVEGLKKVRQYHPDIVVTDLMMPEMTGMELLAEIRKDFQISHIPLVILTAKHDDEAKIQATNMGANAYITKPFSKEYLMARMEQLLGDRRMFREKIRKAEPVKEKPQEDDTYENYLQKKDIQFLEKIHQVIEENLDNSDFNIDSIADTLGISRSAFFKKLKSLTGLAPVDMIKEIRLTKSVELLQNTDMTVSEIAFAVGFKESGYYGKCFRKKYGQTPTEYMSKYRKR